ncbi:hypothetical protein [Desulfosporosinus sp. FKA]|uniref:hypothetical protein n=1 Tax=Desulfosporosinus sp. FKA TaxID=1969834 RepID=UPI000B499308|nr:hypothetical protein [Desulfosporosinus sp. FKA]
MLKKRTFLIMKLSVLFLLTGLSSLLLLKLYPQESKCFNISGVQNSPIVNILPLLTPIFDNRNTWSVPTISIHVNNNSVKEEKIDHAVLMGQFIVGKSTIELPNPKGQNIYKISARGGKVLLSHRAYNPDGHNWSYPPGNNQLQYISITGETPNTYDIQINESYGKLDKVYLTNPNLWGSVNIEYSVQKAS